MRSFDERLEGLQRFASGLTSDPNWLKKTELPRDSDFAFIGRFIQVYCSADLNARATINAMRFITKTEVADFAGSLNDTDVILHLNICASEWTGAPHIAEGVRKAAAASVPRVRLKTASHDDQWQSIVWRIERRMGVAGIVTLRTGRASDARIKGTRLDEQRLGVFSRRPRQKAPRLFVYLGLHRCP